MSGKNEWGEEGGLTRNHVISIHWPSEAWGKIQEIVKKYPFFESYNNLIRYCTMVMIEKLEKKGLTSTLEETEKLREELKKFYGEGVLKRNPNLHRKR